MVYKKRPPSRETLPGNVLWFTNPPSCNVNIYEGDVEVEGFGPAIWLGLSRGVRSAFKIDLAEMTHAELLAVQEVINKAIDLALPICERRDKLANEYAAADEDAIFTRSYRAIPRVVTRSRALNIDSEVLLLRPVNVDEQP